jgi:hypothetical protein
LKKRHNSGDTSVKKKPGSGYESHKENYTMSENLRRRIENTQEDVKEQCKQKAPSLETE